MNMQQMIVTEGGPAPVRFCVDDYLALDRIGLLRRYVKTELIEGVIVAVNAQYSRHGHVQRELVRTLFAACAKRDGSLDVWFEVSVALSDDSMPQPDIFLAEGMPRNAPAPLESVKLVIEVADSSLDSDLGVKLRLYAEAGIPEYWVADVNAGVLHQMWAPADGIYSERRAIPFGHAVTVATIPDFIIATDRLA